MSTQGDVLDPAVLDRVAGLELAARKVVEGFVTGRHDSPFKGSSVEFRQHREYAAGDDLRRLDWKVFAKKDRFYVREYEEETNVKAYLVVDTSRSMAYAPGDGSRPSKLRYAKLVAASLAKLVSDARDLVALALWAHKDTKFIPPKNGEGHVHEIATALADAQPADAASGTDLGALFEELAAKVRHRSLVVILSDLFDDRTKVLEGLARVAQRGHDAIVMHVLDPDELNFPFDRMTRFEALEAGPLPVTVDARALREAYLAEMSAFTNDIRARCLAAGVDHLLLDTGQDPGTALASYLARRLTTR
ncbi:MAG: hypothetical protein RIS21_594 [Planctomycetota bacterium]|jgi:uncharacterized protein (DUF58 family)